MIDGNTNKVIKKIEFVSGVPEIAVNEATNKIYVTDEGPPNLYVVDGNTDTIIKTIPNAGYEQSVSEKYNKVFLANYDAGDGLRSSMARRMRSSQATFT